MKQFTWADNETLFEYATITVNADSLEHARLIMFDKISVSHQLKVMKIHDRIPFEFDDEMTQIIELNNEIVRFAELLLYIKNTMPEISEIKWATIQ